MTRRTVRNGFTLIEMSLVLVVIGSVIMIVYPALQAVRTSTQQQVTSTNLQNLLKASAAFVQATGCVPCPTPASTLGEGFGRVRGEASGPLCGGCPVSEGIAPYASLGLPITSAKDGWGRWITLRVDPALTTNFGSAPPDAKCLPSDPLPCVSGESKKGLCQEGTLLPAGNRLSILTPGAGYQHAAILFVSHGPNGYGAYYADPVSNNGTDQHPAYKGPATPCSQTTGYERCNVNNDLSFVNAAFSNDPSAPFDDQLAYLDRNSLVSFLGNASCQTAW